MAELNVSVNPSGAVAGSAVANRSIASMGTTATATQGKLAGLASTLFSLKGAAAVGAIGAGAGLVTSFTKAIRVTNDLDVALAGVAAVSGATQKQMAALEKQARELGASTQFSAGQTAEAQEFLAKAGFTVAETMESVAATLDLAASGSMDLGRAADIASNVLSAFSKDASELENVVDVMAATASSANTDIVQLGEAMKLVAPIANSMSVSIEETSAAIGVLSNAGLQGSMAGTGLRRVLTELVDPSDKLAKAMNGLTLEQDGLNAVMQEIAKSGLDATEALEIFGQRGGPAFSVMQQGAFTLEELVERLHDVDGIAKLIAEKRLDNLSGDFRQLNSAVDELAITIGRSGLNEAARTFVQTLTEMARSDAARVIGENLVPATVNLLKAFTALAAARFLAPMLATIATNAATLTTALIGSTGLQRALILAQGQAAATAVAMRGLNAALTLVGGPAGVAVLAAIGVYRLVTAESELEKVTRRTKEAQEGFITALKLGDDALQDRAIAAIKATEAQLKFLEAQLEGARFEYDLEGVGNPQTEFQRQQIAKFSNWIAETRGELQKLNSQFKDTYPAIDAFGGLGPKIKNAWDGVPGKLDDAGDSAGGAADAFQEFVENFRTDEQRLELFSQKLLFLNEKFNEGELSLASYNNAVIALNGSIRDLIPETEKLVGTDFGLGEALNTALGEMETALKESERAAEQWNKIWDNAVQNMQREFGETIHGALWDDGIKSFSDFADSLLDIWKRMISEMIAAWMINGIAGLFSGQGVGGFSLGGFSIGSSGGTGGGIGGTAISAGISKAFKSSGIGEAVKSGFSSLGSKLGFETAASGAETFALGAQGGKIAGVPLVSGQLAGTQAGAVQALTSNAAYTGAGTGGSAVSGGAAAGWGAAGLAIPFVAGQIIKELKIGGFGDTPEYVKALRDMKNSDAIGTRFGEVGQGERGGFFRGQNAGFVSQFAQNSGANTVGGGGRVGQGLADNYGAVSFQGMDLENVIELLGEAQREFNAVQKTAVTAMKASGNEVNKIGEAMQNGIIEPVELASFGWVELGERITNTKDGTARYADLTVDSFNKINQAVNSGEIRMEALRGEVEFNQREIQALERIGVGSAGALERAFGSAEQRVYALGDGAARSFGVIGSAAINAANDANAAFNSIRVPGGRSFGVNPAQNAVNTNRIPGLATGGSFMVGGEYGRDNNIVQFKASRGERVTVETPQQQKNGTNVQVNVYAPEGSSVERRERDGPDGRTLDIIIDNAVANNLSRAGSRTANSLSRSFGSSRQLRRR